MTDAKICGLKTMATLNAALDGGADYVGLVFFAKSPRHVTLAQAAILADRASGKVGIVALVVDPEDASIDAIVSEVAPDVFQLHGHESPDRVSAIRSRIGRPVWKAVPVATTADAERANDYAGIADLIVFDAKAPVGAVLPGGNGHAFDWQALDAVKGRLRFMLSGGLNPDNVAQAIAITGATAVDVSSGVETSPGVKDPELIHRFLRAVKQAR